MKVLELFSGIGGMHFACQEAERLSNARLVLNVVAAVDINTSANAVYRANFPDTKLLGRNIQALSVEEMVALRPEVVLMSPPCQPFTRTGLKRDLLDARCDALSYLVQVLPRIPSLKYLLLENVKGFEQSQSRDLFTRMLTRAGFKFQELLLSPTQFGVPNSRTRYYLIGKKSTGPDDSEAKFCFETSGELITALPKLRSGVSLNPVVTDMTLQTVLDTTDESDTLYQKYRVSDKDLVRRFNVYDIVSSGQATACTNCFTKAYTHYAEGTGSVLSNIDDITQIEEIIEKAKTLLKKAEPDNTSSSSASSPKKRKLQDLHNKTDADIHGIDDEKDNEEYKMKETEDKSSGKEEKVQNETDKNIQNTEANTDSNVKHTEEMDTRIKEKSTESSKIEDSDSNCGEPSKPTTSNQTVEILSELSRLNLRYFSPNEIRKLMCFPDRCRFPPSCSDKAKYKLLGNSINVHVVAYCICLMLFEGDQ